MVALTPRVPLCVPEPFQPRHAARQQVGASEFEQERQAFVFPSLARFPRERLCEGRQLTATTSIAVPRHKRSWKGPARRWHVHCPSRAGPFFDDTAYRPSPSKYLSMAAVTSRSRRAN